ncbi:MAG: hypothetical protein QGG14_05490 [Planctomycetota bacterium]|jgi:hypothetical protein|nr:hypothetical protein [Planctomycetota bacterium]
MSAFPNLVGCLAIGPKAIGRVLLSPAKVGIPVLAVAIVSFLLVLPVWRAVAEALDHHPLAGDRFGRFLYADLERLQPSTNLSLGASMLASMLLWSFFAGGVLVCVGKGKRRRFDEFIGASARWLLRSIRCWVVFAALLALWSWLLLGVAKPYLEAALVEVGNEGSQERFALGLNVTWLVGFAKLWAHRRLSLAHMIVTDRRSALLACMHTALLIVRRPLRTLAAFLGLFAVWALGLAVSGMGLERLLQAEHHGLALAVGVVALVWYQVAIAASWLVARQLVEHDVAARPAGEEAGIRTQRDLDRTEAA